MFGPAAGCEPHGFAQTGGHAMVPRSIGRSARRGFTLIELLVAMALLIFLMTILSQAFSTGVESFRKIKAIGDIAEGLRKDASSLRTDLLRTNLAAQHFIRRSMARNEADPEETEVLRLRYETIIADGDELEEKLRAIENQVVNPAAKRILQDALADLHALKLVAAEMVEVLILIQDL
jgi:prepilin-type N-terminal cleavage/methylation domain-containing protein